ncbi:tetratricopeptide repeat protein [Verrucomicrobiota bacterium sgz303538]
MAFPRTIAISFALAVVATGAELPSSKVIDRYRQMLSTNPVEGTALDRIWKAYADSGKSAELINQYQREGTFSSEMVLGHLFRRTGQNDDARAAYSRAAKLQPDSPLPALALGKLHKEAGQHREAAECYEKASELLPKGDAQLTDALLEAGQAWIGAGDNQKAAAAWERAVALSPDNVELRRRLADSYVANDLAERAVAHLEYLVSHAPPSDRTQALQQLARVQQTMGDTDAAIQALEKAIALTTPGNWLRDELQLQLIRLHQRTHRIPELEERWKRHTAENPRDIGGYLQLIALYDRIANLEEERVWLEKLVKLAPKTPAYRLQLARLYAKLDQIKAAGELYDQLLVEQPSNSDLVFERARLDLLQANPDAAKQRISALLQRSKNEESVRSKALEFFYQHRLWAAVEEQLATNAARGEEEQVVTLAEFLFSQGRDDEAEAQLRRLVRNDSRPEEQAHGWIRIAQILKGQGRFSAANTAIGETLDRLDAKVPMRRDALLLAGELRSAMGEPESARPVLIEAVTLSRTSAEQLAAEQKLFDCLRQLGIASGEMSGRADELVIPPSSDGGGTALLSSLPKALGEYIAGLRREAEKQKSEAAWLRLARWYSWCRDSSAALDAANKAVAAEPKSIAAHEFIVKLTASAPTSIAPHWHLGKLAEVDPANRAQYQRRIAQLNIQAGNITDALSTLEKLAKEQPGNIDVITDLATAQQRMEQWEQSLATWQKVLAASPASRRAEAIGPLLRIYDRLHRYEPAADLLLKEVDAKSEPKEQLERFSDLLDFSAKHQLLPWLRAEWEKRKKRLGDDYVTDVSLGRILKAQGEKAAGFQLLVDASLSAPDPSVALPELVREAETSRKLDEAVHLQERLVRSTAMGHFDAWLKLAELQEKTFAFDQAGQTWTRIAARFPRDAGALMQASEFWQREGDSQKAADLLRRIRALEPGNSRALLSLAQLDLESGGFDEASECLEEILRHTPVQKSSEQLRLPGLKPEDGSRLQSAYLATVRSRGGQPQAEAMRDLRNFWSDTPLDAKGNEKDLRLNAIRELGRLVRARNDASALTQWIQRWKTTSESAPTEALWALYYANAGDAALDLVESFMRREPANVQYKQGFIWMALQASQGTRLATWLRDPQRTTSENDFLMIALGQHLDARGTISPEMLDQLFPTNASARLWQVASMFASRMRFEEAVKLGTRAFKSEGVDRSSIGLELAHWHLSTGDIAGACAILRPLSEELADSFESPSCSATRELYLLLPVNERTGFVEQRIAMLQSTPPVHAAVMATLLYGLDGNETAARAQIDRLLHMRVMAAPPPEEAGNSSSRQWTFYTAAGLHLQAWKLGKLAEYLWEKALADPSLARLEGEQAREISREMRTKLAALKLAQLPPVDAAIMLDRVLGDLPSDDSVPLGEALESLGALPQAIALYRKLWEREPSDPQPLRNLLNVCRMADDQETTEAVLRTCISERTFPNDTVQRDFAGQLADLLDRKADVAGAIKILTEAVATVPQDPRLLQRLAQLHEKAGHTQEAEAAWRQLLALEPGHAVGRASLANLLEHNGDLPGALAVLERPDLTESDAQFPVLLLKNKQVDEAFDALERVPPAKLATAAQNLAQEFVESDQRSLARAALQEALEHVSDPAVVFQLRTRLVETFSPETESPTILHELRNLRRLARANVTLAGDYLTWLQQKARTLSAAEFAREELLNAWANGKGPLEAGQALIGLHLEAKENAAIAAVVTQLLARPEASAPLLEGIANQLENTAPPALLARIHERLTKINPLDDERVIAWARALNQAGNREAALCVLDRWGARAWLSDDSAGKIAQAYVELEANGKADSLFAHAIEQDIPRRNFRTLLDYARLQRERRNFPKAHYLLRAAFRQPACREYGEIVAWMSAADQMEQVEQALASLHLPGSAAIPLRQAVFNFYSDQGKASEALQVISAHPEIGTPSVLAKLRPLASRSGAYATCAEILEKSLANAGGEKNALVCSSLALLHSDWADARFKAGNQAEALTHYRRATEIQPDLFPAVKRLAAFHERNGAVNDAVQVLERFIKVTKDQREREQAGKFIVAMRQRSSVL